MKFQKVANYRDNAMKKTSKIYVAGGTGLVGSAIIRKLKEKGYNNIISTYYNRKPVDKDVKWFKIDLTNQQQVEEFFRKEKPKYVFLAAAKVGGIWANNVYRADFIYQNLQIQNNVIYNAYKYGVKKLLFLGSTCIYPKNCPQPIKEEYLLTAPLEYTNEPYAIAKIAGIKMCESFNLQYGTNFISVMPTNLYGYNDNFDLETSHVLPALIRKMHLGKLLENNDWEGISKDLDKNPIEGVNGKVNKEKILEILEKYGIKIVSSKKLVVSSENKKNTNSSLSPINSTLLTTHSVQVEIWGTGKPKREFLWSDDMADACVYLMENVDFIDIVKQMYPELDKEKLRLSYTNIEIRNTHINIGTGEDISIEDLAFLVKEIVGFKGELYFNTDKPDGTMRKVTDVSKLHSLGWKHKERLEKGIKKLYEWYKNYNSK